MGKLVLDSFRLRDLQHFHADLDKVKNFDQDLLRNVAFLAGELGELVRAIQYVRRPQEGINIIRAKGRIGEELADILAYLLKLSNYAGVDLEEAYRLKMEVNLERNWPDIE